MEKHRTFMGKEKLTILRTWLNSNKSSFNEIKWTPQHFKNQRAKANPFEYPPKKNQNICQNIFSDYFVIMQPLNLALFISWNCTLYHEQSGGGGKRATMRWGQHGVGGERQKDERERERSYQASTENQPPLILLPPISFSMIFKHHFLRISIQLDKC